MIFDKTGPFAEKFGDGPLYAHHTTSLIFNDPPPITPPCANCWPAPSPRANWPK